MSATAITWEGFCTMKMRQYRRGLLALGDQGLVSITNFATALLIGRVCGKPELGVYTLAWTLLSMVTEISGALITTPYTVFSPQLSRFRKSRYLGSLFVHQLVFAIIFALVIVSGACLGSLYGWISHSLRNVFATTAGAVVFVCVKEFVRRVSFAELKIGSAFLIDAMACGVQVGGVLLLFHLGSLSTSRTLEVLGISSAVAAGIWLWLRRRTFRFESLLYERDLRRNWRFAKWVLASGLLSAIARYLYPWMLAAFHGTSATGGWAACAAIVAMCNPAVLGLSNYALPRISNIYARSGSAAMQRSVNRFSLLFVLLLLPVVVTLGACGERIVTGVYGMAYAGSAAVLFLLGLNMLINTLTNPYSQGLFNLDSAKADTLINVLWVVLLFTVGIVAVRLYAATGAASALLVSSSITAAVRIGVFARKVRGASGHLINAESDGKRANTEGEKLTLAGFTSENRMARS
jgi:O-antigen/teichoic acid export membrane protein